MVYNCDSGIPLQIQFDVRGYRYEILHGLPTNRFILRDDVLQRQLSDRSCFSFEDLSLPKSPFASFAISPNLTLFTCANRSYSERIQGYFGNYSSQICDSFTVYYRNSETAAAGGSIPPECSVIDVPLKSTAVPIEVPLNSTAVSDGQLFNLLSSDFTVEWTVSEDCSQCHERGGQCRTNNMHQFRCKREKSKLKLILATSISGGAFLLLLCTFVSYIIWRRKKRINEVYLLSRSISFDPSSNSDIDGRSFYFGIPIFSYTELEKATNNFDSSKELGDGGFGTVYYGKIKDGREVAIKRLYEHNYKQVEQFMNEIKILTGLRHRNLVSLYGCTSRRSQELLLVYEYISNGTVADHLHGEQAKEAPLTWANRMSIAIETANALAYLHKSDIIHRDIKTNNILLDNNFCVKVADFGLSRLFPNDVTHISTAPQGTPGYVDPEYHQCYQLTDRSDVYSFGVVLIELISSMPAVDITRHRHEINLANLALNRIQMCAFDELIDSSLGYKSDAEVRRMTTSVAELAFRCLQLEKDLRPSMDEVLDFLINIQSGEDGECYGEINRAGPGKKIPSSPESDDAVLLKNKNFQSSPTAVTDVWVSSGSTTTSSIG
ncbi:hypothetical protein BUALT_Bualt17G0100900 [Buddleja alternifolia]|uniref:Protein kinase domain-containing protein n=1 Tax=Buddleja alternifolia TaxID=168488 RepID=A0AAV6WE37_9LAMI|nr:hypothetical protein BUALT_Bualt17G0100900 [Buddleja alternifolia]